VASFASLRTCSGACLEHLYAECVAVLHTSLGVLTDGIPALADATELKAQCVSGHTHGREVACVRRVPEVPVAHASDADPTAAAAAAAAAPGRRSHAVFVSHCRGYPDTEHETAPFHPLELVLV
jgi:hypothetical protein